MRLIFSQQTKVNMEEDFDLEEPLIQSPPADSVSSLFATESQHTPALPFKTCPAIASFRRDVLSSISFRQSQLSCHPSVAYLAVNYLDRFLSVHGLPGEEGFIFDTDTIRRMELLILSALKWRMRSITPFAFLGFFLSFFESNDLPLKEAIKARASEIVFKAQNEIKILEYKLSVIAASALLYASYELSPLQFPSFREAISSSAYINKEKLSDCCNLMQTMVIDGYGSILLDDVSSTDTPVNVLDCHCWSSESEKTSKSSSGSNKKRKIGDFTTFHQISQIQQC